MSLFKVPEHIASVIFGGGCGVAHSGESDCKECAPLAAVHNYLPAPAAEPATADPAAAPAADVAAADESVPEPAPAKARKNQPTE